MNWERLGALTGVAFVVLAVTSVIVSGGEPPDPSEDSVQEIIDFYVDNKDAVFLGSVLQALAASLIVFFAGYLRKVLRASEGPGHALSSVVLAGASVLATAVALDATINIALAETADDIEPAGVQALSALWSNDYLPLAVGTQVFILAVGLSIVRHRALPAWLGWIAIALGVIAVTPIGFVAFLGMGLWILIVSVMLAMRADAVTPERPVRTPAA